MSQRTVNVIKKGELRTYLGFSLSLEPTSQVQLLALYEDEDTYIVYVLDNSIALAEVDRYHRENDHAQQRRFIGVFTRTLTPDDVPSLSGPDHDVDASSSTP